MESINPKQQKLDYLLVTLVIALTGFEFLYRASINIQVVILLCLILLLVYKREEFKLKFFFLVFLFVTPIILQGVYINDFYAAFANVFSYIVKFSIAYIVITLSRNRFPNTYVTVIYFLSLISLLFFPTQFSESLTITIKSFADSIIKPIGTENLPRGYVSSTLILFTYQHAYGAEFAELRNCGPFWEPGMYAIFLNIALFINIFILKSNPWSFKNIIFIITIITTVSTTGVISLAFLLSVYFFLKFNKIGKIFFLPFLFIFLYFFYNYIWGFEFISGKIEQNISVFQYDRRSRFGAILFHYNYFKESPLIGGVLNMSRNEKYSFFEERLVSPNGISLVFLNFGILVGMLYFIFFYKGIKRFLYYYGINSKMILLSFFIILLILAFSQDITVRLFYIMFVLFYISYPPISNPRISKN